MFQKMEPNYAGQINSLGTATAPKKPFPSAKKPLAFSQVVLSSNSSNSSTVLRCVEKSLLPASANTFSTPLF